MSKNDPKRQVQLQAFEEGHESFLMEKEGKGGGSSDAKSTASGKRKRESNTRDGARKKTQPSDMLAAQKNRKELEGNAFLEKLYIILSSPEEFGVGAFLPLSRPSSALTIKLGLSRCLSLDD